MPDKGTGTPCCTVHHHAVCFGVEHADCTLTLSKTE